MRKFAILIFAAGCGLSLARPVSGVDLLLTGRVRAVARVHLKTGVGAPVYADRALMYAPLFDYNHLQNVVVYAEPDPAAPVPAEPSSAASFVIRMNRSALSMKPEFLAVPKSAPVRITNETAKPVILYAAGDMPEPFSLTVGAHDTVEAHPATSGLYRVRCLADPELRAKIYVAGARARTAGSDGSYQLPLPAGRYKVTAWHERLPPQTQEVDLTDSGPRELNFELSVRELPVVP